ncbi:M48 metallopeptidase family protein [Mycoplasma sp. CB776]
MESKEKQKVSRELIIDNLAIKVEQEVTTSNTQKIALKKDFILVKNEKILDDEQLIEFIRPFFNKYKDKIITTLFTKDIDLDNRYFYLFGEKIHCLFDLFFGKYKFVPLRTGFQPRLLKTKKQVIEYIEEIRKRELLKYLLVRLTNIEKEMGIKHQNRVFVRVKKSTWGTNHIFRKEIYFSEALSPFSKDIIDSVIYHELAHCFVPNHSKEFWDIVYKYCPDYDQKTKKLNNKEYQ